MRELQIGDRVRTPRGVGEVTGVSRYTEAWRVMEASGEQHWWDADDLIPLRRDVPREHVADLHAAVVKRMGQLSGFPYAEAFARRELSEVAEALRLLLEGAVCDGE